MISEPYYNYISKDIQNLPAAWATFLARFEPFEWFANLTFKEDIHPEQGVKRFRRWIRTINELQFGVHYRKRGVGIHWVLAHEYQKRGVLHFHALIGGGVKGLNRASCQVLWHSAEATNGFAYIKAYNPQLGARGYVSKYVSKGGRIDLFLPTVTCLLESEQSQSNVNFTS